MQQIKIPIELRNKIQQADIKRSATRDLILYILEHEIDIPEERLEMLKEQYTVEYYNFEQLKGQLEKDYIEPKFKNNVNWKLDYSTDFITIFEDDE